MPILGRLARPILAVISPSLALHTGCMYSSGKKVNEKMKLIKSLMVYCYGIKMQYAEI